ncbi:hypothetical protein KP003_14200 [Geomonas nitrogeniifigens]|uniref:hypothetical protein n=1 Tax=Geomonas diazotrophica TaxID=2843197 RepID=UPI001C2C9207|nr:hypothetical protein [Geomonas nitrogeniifigens]QXE85528.1 hypothetical protein KP003_14200 [Geomonas nitrogeniifigens]
MEIVVFESRLEALKKRFLTGEPVRLEASALEAEFRQLPVLAAPDGGVEASTGMIAAAMRRELKLGPLAIPEDFPDLAEQVGIFEGRPVTAELVEALTQAISSFAVEAEEAEAESDALEETVTNLERDRGLLAGYRELLDNLIG